MVYCYRWTTSTTKCGKTIIHFPVFQPLNADTRKLICAVSITIVLLISLFHLVSCSSAPNIDPAKEPPLQEEDWAIAVPDFLTEEQQLLYRRASNLYCHTRLGSDIEYAGSAVDLSGHETVQIGWWVELLHFPWSVSKLGVFSCCNVLSKRNYYSFNGTQLLSC